MPLYVREKGQRHSLNRRPCGPQRRPLLHTPYILTAEHYEYGFESAGIMNEYLRLFYICSSVHRNSRLKNSNKMQQYADFFTAKLLYMFRVSDLYQRLQLQFYILLMIGAIDARNM